MTGNVYCFNTFGDNLEQFSVNGASASATVPAVAGWPTASSSSTSIYTPYALSVPRARHGDTFTAVFLNDGPTVMGMNWDSGKVETSIDLSQLPHPVSLDEDLILYMSANQMILMNIHGFVLKTVPYSMNLVDAAASAKAAA
ncbi:hypothetical protein Jab_2c14030 [Janthinobacterium sp. HH01]|uniref:hypothetical protein n=1 Tax=Janthinobacterium sp. HH01 TaxID=1198452 RepID=UPI0002AE9305|nr:hypothetical protein [Janthinobacterium sp. HH01]ELX09337.1 hypothetical protein Jab_2c14030 [Janthinobacterium sp. HH01]